MSINCGDVVKVKNNVNHPKMTANGFRCGSRIHCLWFEGSTLHEGTFDEEILEKVECSDAKEIKPGDLVILKDSRSSQRMVVGDIVIDSYHPRRAPVAICFYSHTSGPQEISIPLPALKKVED